MKFEFEHVDLDVMAEAAFYACMRSYDQTLRTEPAASIVLDDISNLISRPDWDALEERHKDHWRGIMAAAITAHLLESK